MNLNTGITIRLAPDVREKLETLAIKHGVKASVIVRQAIFEKLDEVEREEVMLFPVRKSLSAKRRKKGE